MLNQNQKAYLAGFLDGDGSIYVRAKPNPSYKYGFQVAPYIVFFQSQKDAKNFKKVYSLINFGHLRVRKDGILEYVINKNDEVKKFIEIIQPFVILKREQITLLKKILRNKERVKNRLDFNQLLKLIDSFRNLNYSKKRKKRVLTP